MKFAELTEGRRITLGPIATDAQEVVDFARKYDPQWFHTDPEKAGAGPWGGLIASGWQTCGMAMRLVCDHVLAGSESFGSPGLNYVRWPNPVRPGDQLMLEVTVKEARVSKSKAALGIVRWQWVLRNQNGKQVLDLEAVSLFNLDGQDRAPGDD
ncbi:Acyl dehydratase [Noviherbaspirillum humi]|uniref:Acyl dehydratase n=1 Tax=Noviherbaspirillum humi TaxID=1688639 RepID=A0A239K3M4_9BURK|nr:MaoC family dehydratase [Noviherbaspirillum humi]SNT12368.1 Acyl dehydratase [Noviherbaspirillum humi]